MKIILTGATGFTGGEALRQLVNDPGVTQITCIARREIGLELPKMKTMVLKDFTHYDRALAQSLAEHDGCVWTLGGKASDLGPDAFEQVTTTFTLALAKAVSAHLARPFRFVYLSGMGADPAERATFPWEKLTRHMKGRTERLLEAEAKAHPFFRATAFRPAGILPSNINPLAYALLSPIGIRVDVLCQAMLREIKQNRQAPYRMLNNSEIKRLADGRGGAAGSRRLL